MQKFVPTKGYSFDDVLAVPRYSQVTTDTVSLANSEKLSLNLAVPIFSAAMDKVTEAAMANAIFNFGGLGIIHKNGKIENQLKIIDKLKESGNKNIACAVGVNDDKNNRIDALVNAGANILLINTAHGHSYNVQRAISFIKTNHPHVILFAGNVATYDGAKFLFDLEVDGITVGIGSGSICTTRIVSGCGVPQVTAIMEARRAKISSGKSKAIIIADGGIKNSGDAVKAFVAGADAIMLGSMLSGCDESPGETIEKDGKKYKEYRGMGSLAAMKDGSADRYGRGEGSAKTAPEGIEAHVECSGSLDKVLTEFVGGIKSGMGYLGCSNINELKDCQFIEITPAGMAESKPHSVIQNLNL